MVWVCSVPFQSLVLRHLVIAPFFHTKRLLKRESARGLHVEMPCSFFICCFNGDGGGEVPLSAPDSTLPLAHTHGMMYNVLSLELTIFIELPRRRTLLTKPPFKITGRASQKQRLSLHLSGYGERTLLREVYYNLQVENPGNEVNQAAIIDLRCCCCRRRIFSHVAIVLNDSGDSNGKVKKAEQV